MEIREIVNELNERGYNATEVKAMKTFGEVTGISIREEGVNIAPVIYPNLENKLEEEVERIIDMYNNTRMSTSLDINDILTKEYVLENAMLCLYPAVHNEDIVSRDFLDLKEIVKISVELLSTVESSATITVTNKILEKIKMTEDELFEAAHNNVKGFATPLGSLIAPFIGVEDMEALNNSEQKMYVLSSDKNVGGAAAMIDAKAIEEVCGNSEGCFILPSSIHEVIVIKNTDINQKEYLDAMVREVNETQVAPEEVLSDHAYWWNNITKRYEY